MQALIKPCIFLRNPPQRRTPYPPQEAGARGAAPFTPPRISCFVRERIRCFYLDIKLVYLVILRPQTLYKDLLLRRAGTILHTGGNRSMIFSLLKRRAEKKSLLQLFLLHDISCVKPVRELMPGERKRYYFLLDFSSFRTSSISTPAARSATSQ
jgi:hypothetical protein